MTPQGYLAAVIFVAGLLGIPFSWWLYYFHDVIDLPQFHMLSGACCALMFCGILQGLMVIFKIH
jgi:hypothetical protein